MFGWAEIGAAARRMQQAVPDHASFRFLDPFATRRITVGRT